jgi:hypothetical protein
MVNAVYAVNEKLEGVFLFSLIFSSYNFTPTLYEDVSASMTRSKTRYSSIDKSSCSGAAPKLLEQLRLQITCIIVAWLSRAQLQPASPVYTFLEVIHHIPTIFDFLDLSLLHTNGSRNKANKYPESLFKPAIDKQTILYFRCSTLHSCG